MGRAQPTAPGEREVLGLADERLPVRSGPMAAILKKLFGKD
jgi:hypothetical protein